MKNIILTLLIAIITSVTAKAIEIDTLWYRTAGSVVQELDFTPDDKYVISWTNAIEFWEVEKGVKEFSIPIDNNAVGDYNYNGQYLVFAKDSTPKLLDWKTKEVIEGFEKEERPLGRIRTAKSKNEFMAQTINSFKHQFYKDQNILYFWDIDTKQKVDSVVSLNIFDKDGYRWSRKTIDYDYLGESDEFVCIKYADNNSYEIPIEPMYHTTNTFYHIYNIQTKELLDSIFVYQSTIENNGFFADKLKILNDRSKIAWNYKGGEINFYKLENDELLFLSVFKRQDFSKVNDIEFSMNDKLMSLTYGLFINVFNLEKGDIFASFNTGSTYGQCKLSSNQQYMIANVTNSLIMHPVTLSSVETDNAKTPVIISPNPTSNFVSIELNCSEPKVDYQITDINGATVSQSTLANQSGNLQLDLSNYSTGVYFLTINCKEHMTYKIIKE